MNTKDMQEQKIDTLPKNWVKTDLGNLLYLKNGYSFKSGKYLDEGNAIIRISDIQDGSVTTKKSVFVEEDEIYDNFIIKKGDVLIAMSGATTGKYGFFIEDTIAYQNQRVGNLKPFSEKLFSKEMIFYLLGAYKKEIFEKAYGGAQPNISTKLIESLKINLPPLPEQNRIVAKLDVLFGQLDKINAGLDKIPTLLKNFKQAVLSQAVTGKLTEEYKTEKNVLKNIILDREKWYSNKLQYALKNKTKKPKKIITELTEGKEFFLEFLYKNYDIAYLEEIAAKKENALKAGPFGSALKKSFYVPKGYKIYGQEQVIKGDINYGDYYVNQEKYDSLKSCAVDSGDILISLVGTIGKVLVIPNKFEKGIINPRLVKLSLHENISPQFFSIYIQSPLVKRMLDKMAHGGVMDVLNLGILKKIPIPVPSLKEQTEIVKRVESLFARAEALEAHYKALKAQVTKLPQAILAKAFKGELVEQLETDGDAADLLKEILVLKEELASSASATKKSSRALVNKKQKK